MLQLTHIASSSPYGSGAQLNMTYTYSATQNNGRIVSSVDGVTGRERELYVRFAEPADCGGDGGDDGACNGATRTAMMGLAT